MNSARAATSARLSAQQAATCTLIAVMVALTALTSALGSANAAEANRAKAKTAAAYTVTRHVIAAGGGISSGNAYVIHGSIGQHDADPLQPSSGGDYAITGGYWSGYSIGISDTIFANGFENPGS